MPSSAIPSARENGQIQGRSRTKARESGTAQTTTRHRIGSGRGEGKKLLLRMAEALPGIYINPVFKSVTA